VARGFAAVGFLSEVADEFTDAGGRGGLSPDRPDQWIQRAKEGVGLFRDRPGDIAQMHREDVRQPCENGDYQR
jgi:hypothetical protein